MPVTVYGNVQYLAVARIENGKGIVLVSHAHSTEVDNASIKKVFDDPGFNMTAGQHYNYMSGGSVWNFYADQMKIIYILITKSTYPPRCARQCLEELQRTFSSKAGDKAGISKEKSLNNSCGSLLKVLGQKYDNLKDIDKLSSVSMQVDTVKLVMQQNIDIALANCVKMESIDMTAEELQKQAGVFHRSAKELKSQMWWKNMKMKLLLALIILAILGIIAGGVAIGVMKAKSAANTANNYKNNNNNNNNSDNNNDNSNNNNINDGNNNNNNNNNDINADYY